MQTAAPTQRIQRNTHTHAGVFRQGDDFGQNDAKSALFRPFRNFINVIGIAVTENLVPPPYVGGGEFKNQGFRPEQDSGQAVQSAQVGDFRNMCLVYLQQNIVHNSKRFVSFYSCATNYYGPLTHVILVYAQCILLMYNIDFIPVLPWDHVGASVRASSITDCPCPMLQTPHNSSTTFCASHQPWSMQQ